MKPLSQAISVIEGRLYLTRYAEVEDATNEWVFADSTGSFQVRVQADGEAAATRQATELAGAYAAGYVKGVDDGVTKNQKALRNALGITM